MPHNRPGRYASRITPRRSRSSRSLRTLPAVAAFFLCTFILGASTGLAQTTIHIPADQPTIQAGINAAKTGDTVLVSPGTYYENIDFKGKAITVTSSGGAAKTIIDGAAGGVPAVTFANHETRLAILNGFTVQNGGNTNYFYNHGGAYVSDSAPTIINNIFTHNRCQGVFSTGAPLIQNNEIDNTLDTPGECTFGGGSAIWLDGSYVTGVNASLTPVIIGNILQNNTQSGVEDAGGNGGAGVSSWTNNAVIEYNTIRNNLTHGQGGGIHLENSGGLVLNNLVYANESGGGGGGLDANGYYGPVTTFIANNTFADNTYGGGGGSSIDEAVAQIYFGPFASSGNSLAFVNNIVAGTSPQPSVACGSPSYGSTGAAAIIFDHNLFYNGGGNTFYLCPDPTGTYGNLTAQPQFKNEAAGDFHLLAGSPAIDAGNTSINALLSSNTIQPSAVLMTDFDGQPRLQDSTGKGYPVIDIGAYESAGVQNANATTLLLTPSTYYSNAGVPFTLTAKAFSANGVPTGVLTFTEDGSSLGTVMLDASGTSVLSTGLTPGLHHFVVSYPGQGAFTAATSVQVIVVVNKYSPALTLTSSSNPSQLNSPVTFTVTVTSSDNTVLSPITLTDTTHNVVLATLTPNSSGVATFTTSSLPLGYSYITATYAGDATHNSASASVFQQVTSGYATSTTLTCTPASIASNATTLCTIRVSSSNGTPTGSVTLTDGSTPLATLALTAGSATYTYTGTSAGSHTLTAAYPVTGSFNASSATFYLTVNGLPTTTSTVTVSPEPSTYGQPVIFTAHVTPTNPTSSVPTGTVLFTFCRGATVRATLDATGTATFTTPVPGAIADPVGTCSVYATYSGDATFATSTSPTVPYIVTPSNSTTNISASPNPAYALAPVVVTVTVAGNPSPTTNPITGFPIAPGTTVPSGTVTLSDGANALGSATVTNGKATFTLNNLLPGAHTLNATFAGDPNLNGSSASLTLTVLPNFTSVTLTATPNPGLQGQTINITAQVSDASSAAVPTGSVQFFESGTLLQTVALAPGATTAILSSNFSVGVHALTAVYLPSSVAFATSSSAPLLLTIAAQDFTFTASAPSITIQTEHHSSLQLTLTSLGGFSGPIALSCSANPPPYLTCEWPGNVALAANATDTLSLTLDTDQVLNFVARQQAPPAASGHKLPFALAALLPLSLLGIRRCQRHLRGLFSLLCLAIVSAGLTACTGYYPKSTPPGTYTLPLTATGTSNGSSVTITHSINLTLIVTK